MTSTVCHYHNHGGIDVAIRQVSRPAMSFVYKLYNVSRKCRAWMCKPLLLLRDDCGTKISFLLTWECSYSVFNKRCCYLSFFLTSDTGKWNSGKQKQIGCGQKLHKWVNIHMNFVFSFFGLCVVVACPIISGYSGLSCYNGYLNVVAYVFFFSRCIISLKRTKWLGSPDWLR
jgi:hypothetical protein